MSRTIEVDETQFLGMTQTAKTVAAMLGNPEARKLVFQAQKIVDPTVAIPEIDAAAPVMSEIEKLRQEMAEERKSRAEEKAQAEAAAKLDRFRAEWESKKRALRKQNGYTDEGIAAIEKLAEERGIADIEAAAALFDRLNPPTQPIAHPGVGQWSFFEEPKEDTSGKYLHDLLATRGGNDTVLAREVGAALADVRGARRVA